MPFIQLEQAALARRLGDHPTQARLLRTAHAGFVAIGATGHAERLACRLPS